LNGFEEEWKVTKEITATQTQELGQVITPIFTDEQIKTIKNTVAKGATDDELKMFLNIAAKYGLDPFTKDIWFIKRPKKVRKGNDWDYPRNKDGSIDYTGAETIIMTSRDGYLKIAQRDADFDGIIGFPVKEGDIFEVDAENYTVVHKFGMKRGQIIGAWAKVTHKKRKPVIVWADFKEYNADKSTIWKQYPSAMVQKVAETLALKRQFGISGLTTKEEMSTAYEEYESQPVEHDPIETKQGIVKANKDQKEAIFALGKEKGLVTGEGKTANVMALKQFCMKTVDIPLEHLTYEAANDLLKALKDYVKPEETIEGVELTPQEKETLEQFAVTEDNGLYKDTPFEEVTE
jgi:phage recombination protein Bet